jgi:hypothetical protein
LRIGGTPREKLRSTVGQLTSDRIFSAVERRHLVQELDGFKFIHRPSLLLIPSTHWIAGETQQIANPQGMGTEQISLQGNPVAIPTGHLEHRFQPGIQQKPAQRQTAHAHHRTASVSDIDGMNPAFKTGSHPEGMAGITATGWHHFRCYGDATCFKSALQR